MKIPNSEKKKALFIVDVQNIFLTKKNEYIISNIEKLIQNTKYELYVNAVFYADKNSIWARQTQWTVPKKKAKSHPRIIKALKNLTPIEIVKQSKSCFKGDEVDSSDILYTLFKHDINEIHIVGLDTNDCVLATAYEAFDYEFSTYVIEECTQSSSGKSIHEAGLKLLRHVNLTNNSCLEKKFIKI